jgi:hypothetical protein
MNITDLAAAHPGYQIRAVRNGGSLAVWSARPWNGDACEMVGRDRGGSRRRLTRI